MRPPASARSLSLIVALTAVVVLQPVASGMRLIYQPLRLAELTQSSPVETEDSETARGFDCLAASRARFRSWTALRFHNPRTQAGQVRGCLLRAMRAWAISHDLEHSARQGVSVPLLC